MNLTLEFLRSSKEHLAGRVHVPRRADKARAARDNPLGETIYPCPLDEIMLEFIGVDNEIEIEVSIPPGGLEAIYPSDDLVNRLEALHKPTP